MDGQTNEVHNCCQTLISLTHLQEMQIKSLENQMHKLSIEFCDREYLFAEHLNQILEQYFKVCQQLENSCDCHLNECNKLSVNGRDISKTSYQEAVQVLHTASQPIVVELSRRMNNTTKETLKPSSTPLVSLMSKKENPMQSESNSESNISSPLYCETSTQTEWTGGWTDIPPPFIFPYPTPNSAQMASFLSNDVIVGNHLIENDEDDDDEDGCDVEYEEVTLRLSSNSERLGILFSSPDEENDDILVIEIEAESVAAKDGRIQEGDQILQINGIDVRNREHAQQLFASNRLDFTVLVARAPSQLHEAYTYIQQHQSKLENLEFPRIHCLNHTKIIEEEFVDDFDNEVKCTSVTLENNHLEKDSGVGRTDESTKYEESSTEHEAVDKLSVNNGTMDSRQSQITSESSSGDNSNINESELILEKCENNIKSDVFSAHKYSIHGIDSYLPLCVNNLNSSLDREMEILHQEMQSIQLECESLVNDKRSQQNSLQIQTKQTPNRANFHYQNREKYIQHTYMNIDEIQTNIQTNSSASIKLSPQSQQQSKIESQTSCEPSNSNGLTSFTSSQSSPTNLPKEKKESVERWIKNMPLSAVGSNRKPKLGICRPNMCEEKERDSSSAYNTGESSRSTPLTLELAPIPVAITANKEDKETSLHYRSIMSLVSPCKGMEDKSTQLHESDVASIWSCESCRRCCRNFLESRETILQQNRYKPNNSDSSFGITARNNSLSPNMRRMKCDTFDSNNRESNRNYVTLYPCSTTMYTNEANLQHTIWLQQQLFRESLAKKQFDKMSNHRPNGSSSLPSHKPQMSSFPNIAYSSSKVIKDSSFMSSFNGSVPPSPSKSAPLTSNVRANNENFIKMEWKVKRRPDGSRYITRRPVRNKILKERALKIMEERCSGLTTDDDAMSELKVGRYWNKDERKRHFEKARDRKKREIMIRSTKMAALREHSEEREINNTNGSLTRTANRDNTSKSCTSKRNKLITVQDLNRNFNTSNASSTGSKQISSNGILSVTTV